MSVLLSVVVLVMAAGCGGSAPGSGGPSAMPELAVVGPTQWVQATCPRTATGRAGERSATPVAGGTIPADFHVAWVLRCSVQVQALAGRGQWTVETTERADTSAADLMTQLGQPSLPRAAGSCAAVSATLPYFALVDRTGRALVPFVPTDECGNPRSGVGLALAALPFRAVTTEPLAQVQNQAGCATAWKDSFVTDAGRERSGGAEPLWRYRPTSIRVCVYVDQDSGGAPSAQLTAGRTIEDRGLADLLTRLDGAPAAAPCRTPHTRFAVLAEPRGGWGLAELDGCLRLLREDDTLGQLSPDLARQLSSSS
jgi:hypothetical protein